MDIKVNNSLLSFLSMDHFCFKKKVGIPLLSLTHVSLFLCFPVFPSDWLLVRSNRPHYIILRIIIGRLFCFKTVSQTHYSTITKHLSADNTITLNLTMKEILTHFFFCNWKYYFYLRSHFRPVFERRYSFANFRCWTVTHDGRNMKCRELVVSTADLEGESRTNEFCTANFGYLYRLRRFLYHSNMSSTC